MCHSCSSLKVRNRLSGFADCRASLENMLSTWLLIYDSFHTLEQPEEDLKTAALSASVVNILTSFHTSVHLYGDKVDEMISL